MRWGMCLILAVTLTLLASDANEELLLAARGGDLPTVKALLGKGADLEAKTSYGQTPLYLAAMNGHQDVVAYLLDKGASTQVRDTFYKAPILSFVLMRKHYDIAKLLIAKGGGSPDENLKAVIGTGNVDVVQAVIDKGKPSQESLDKAYEMALTQHKTTIADALRKAGAHEPAPDAQVDGKTLESYAGAYKSEQLSFEINVSVKEGKLYVQAVGQPGFAPKAKSATVFEFAPAQLEVEFDSAASFTLKQGGTNYKFKKAVAQ